MQDRFIVSIHFVLPHECVYAAGHDGDLNFVVPENVAGDAGGVTKFGIDQASHPHLDIRGLTIEQAVQIYHDNEWTRCRCDDLPTGLDTAVFDIAVNNGMGQAIKLLQRALNAAASVRLAVDGFIGAATLAAATAAPAGTLRQLLIERQKLYFQIVEAHPADAKFLKGWLNRNHDLAQFLGVDLTSS